MGRFKEPKMGRFNVKKLGRLERRYKKHYGKI